MTDEQQARLAADMIKEKYDRVKAYLLNQRAKCQQGQELLNNAYAIRIVDSRKRAIDRLFNARYGTEQQQHVARIELALKTQDTGKLIQDENGRQHVQGRLDCRGCDTKPGEGEMPVPMTTLCLKCQNGLQHFYTLIKEIEPLSTLGTGSPARSSGSILQPALFVRQPALLCTRISVCENCLMLTKIEQWREEPPDENIPLKEIRITLPES